MDAKRAFLSKGSWARPRRLVPNTARSSPSYAAAFLTLILESDAPLTAYQLLDQLKETRKGAVPATIYRALDFLIEQRLIHKSNA